MTAEQLVRATSLFACLFLAGSLLCLPLYRMDVRAFFASRLWTKVVWWWPIFGGFLVVLWGGIWVALAVWLGIAAQSWSECREHLRPLRTGALMYFVLVTIALAHLPAYFAVLPRLAVPVLITVCFCSALSDVGAFFLGSFAGRHHLPAWISAHKSWEGVAGQIMGSLLGYLLVLAVFGYSLGWPLAFAIGLASATGDILNSIVKRRLGIKDWGQTLPGHGGFLDRFSSLSLALAAGFWLVFMAQ